MEITFDRKIVKIDFGERREECKFFETIFSIGLDVIKKGLDQSRQLSPDFQKEAQKIINKDRDGLLLVKTNDLVSAIEIDALIFVLSMAESYIVAWNLMDSSKNESREKKASNLVFKREITEILNFLKNEQAKQES